MTRYATPGPVVSMIMALVGTTTAGEDEEPFDGLHGLKDRYSCLSGGDSGDDLDVTYHRGRDVVQFPGSASGGRYKATAPPRDSKSPPTPEELQERLSNIVR
jgi:hypothetical protein